MNQFDFKIMELEKRNAELEEHIQNLQKASQDYCMCGMRIDTHGTENHFPISEFDWYVKEHNL